MSTRVVRITMAAIVLAVYADPTFVRGQARDSQPAARSASPRDSAVISGRVVNAAAPATPIRLALVTLSGSSLDRPRTIVTSDDGVFRFDSVPAGRFTVAARKAAYIDSAFGALGPGESGTPLVVTAGEQLSGLTVPLAPGAAMSGTIRDASGAGLPDATVMAVRTLRVNGEITFRAGAPITATTDDRGAYRLFGLPPDDYVIAAIPPGTGNGRPMQTQTDSEIDEIFRRLERRGQPGEAAATRGSAAPEISGPRGYAPVYFPGTAVAAEANSVRVAEGEDRSGLDFVLASVPAVTVTGTIARPGATMPPLQFYLQTLGPKMSTPVITSVVSPSLYSSSVGPDGVFKYTSVPPGQYRVVVRTTAAVRATPNVGLVNQARAPAEGESFLWGMAEFTVTGTDITGLSISLQPALTVSGRIVFDAPSSSVRPPADLSTLRLTMGAGGGGSVINGTAFGAAPIPPAIVRADGTFEFRGVVPGTYQFNVAPIPAGWFLRSALADGRDTVDLPFEVGTSDVAGIALRFTDRRSELYGTLQTTATDAAARYVVIAFPADRTLWRPGSRWIRLARPSSDGAFAIDNLPDGAYLVALVTNATSTDLEHADFLEQAAQAAVQVRLAAGARVQQDLRVGSAP